MCVTDLASRFQSDQVSTACTDRSLIHEAPPCNSQDPKTSTAIALVPQDTSEALCPQPGDQVCLVAHMDLNNVRQVVSVVFLIGVQSIWWKRVFSVCARVHSLCPYDSCQLPEGVQQQQPLHRWQDRIQARADSAGPHWQKHRYLLILADSHISPQ